MNWHHLMEFQISELGLWRQEMCQFTLKGFPSEIIKLKKRSILKVHFHLFWKSTYVKRMTQCRCMSSWKSPNQTHAHQHSHTPRRWTVLIQKTGLTRKARLTIKGIVCLFETVFSSQSCSSSTRAHALYIQNNLDIHILYRYSNDYVAI